VNDFLHVSANVITAGFAILGTQFALRHAKASLWSVSMAEGRASLRRALRTGQTGERNLQPQCRLFLQFTGPPHPVDPDFGSAQYLFATLGSHDQ
jgi:hypothetical protein